MALTKKQIEVLRKIRQEKAQGDVEAIAKTTNKHPSYVSMVLNPDSTYFNQQIVDEAINLISSREQSYDEFLNAATQSQAGVQNM